MKAAQDKRDELYKQLTISNAEVCKLRVRVSTLEEQLQVYLFFSMVGSLYQIAS